MSAITEFHAPSTLEDTLGVLADKGASAWVLAGGTDVMVRLRRGSVPSRCTTLVSLHRVTALRGCRRDGDVLAICAATTASELTRDPTVAACAPILARVADRLASEQIRNVATIGGNVANASPAGDLINPLLLLDADVVLASSSGRRTVELSGFFTGPGKTVMRPGELLIEVRIGVPPPDRVFRFEKAGTRPAMECSVVTVGLAFTPRDGRLENVRIAFGSSAPTPLRGRETEAVLEGQRLAPQLVDRAAQAAEREVSPISDIRGSERYRRALAGAFVRRLLHG